MACRPSSAPNTRGRYRHRDSLFRPAGEAGIFQFIVLIFQGLYWTFLWSDFIGNGQTIGMSVFNLRLVRKSTGRPIGVTRAAGRELMLLHDKIVDTVVVVEP